MGKSNLLRVRIERDRIAAGVVAVGGAELHHLRVRRLAPGDALVCFDDRGTEYAGIVRRISAAGAEIALAGATEGRRESPLHLTLAQAGLKGDHLDLVVEKATELGVSEIVVFACERSVARPSAAKLDRLRRIAASAAKQSGRVRVPAIRGIVGFAEVLAPPAILFQPGVAASPSRRPEVARVTAIIGPEGGFTAAEIEAAAAAGCDVAGLGPRVLRAETAGIVACGICQWLWGDLA